MFEWEKKGRVVDPNAIGLPWGKEFAQSPSVVVFDKFLRVYFCTRAQADDSGNYTSRIAYADFKRDDLLHWTRISQRPVLELGGKGTFDEHGTYPASAIVRDGEIWMYYAGISRCESVPFNCAIGLAVSRDGGDSFQRLGKGPVISYSPDEPFVMGSPRVRKFGSTYYLWYCAGKKWVRGEGRPEPVYKIRMAYSTDGICWIKQGKDILPSRLEENECQASPDVIFLGGRYHLFFSYRYCLGFKEKGGDTELGMPYRTIFLPGRERTTKLVFELLLKVGIAIP